MLWSSISFSRRAAPAQSTAAHSWRRAAQSGGPAPTPVWMAAAAPAAACKAGCMGRMVASAVTLQDQMDGSWRASPPTAASWPGWTLPG